MHVVCKDLLRSLYKFFYLRLRAASDQGKHAVEQKISKLLEIHFHMKMIATMIPTNLVRSSLLSLFCPLKN